MQRPARKRSQSQRSVSSHSGRVAPLFFEPSTTTTTTTHCGTTQLCAKLYGRQSLAIFVSIFSHTTFALRCVASRRLHGHFLLFFFLTFPKSRSTFTELASQSQSSSGSSQLVSQLVTLSVDPSIHPSIRPSVCSLVDVGRKIIRAQNRNSDLAQLVEWSSHLLKCEHSTHFEEACRSTFSANQAISI